AAAKDPEFALAYAAIAEGYGMLVVLGAMDQREAIRHIRESAQKALDLDDRLAVAHGAMAHVRLWEGFDWAGSEREWRKALELDSDCEAALDSRASHTLAMGQFDLCLKDRLHMRDLEPTVPVFVMGPSWPLYYSGRYEESLVHTRRALDLDSRFARGYNDL